MCLGADHLDVRAVLPLVLARVVTLHHRHHLGRAVSAAAAMHAGHSDVCCPCDQCGHPCPGWVWTSPCCLLCLPRTPPKLFVAAEELATIACDGCIGITWSVGRPCTSPARLCLSEHPAGAAASRKTLIATTSPAPLASTRAGSPRRRRCAGLAGFAGGAGLILVLLPGRTIILGLGARLDVLICRPGSSAAEPVGAGAAAAQRRRLLLLYLQRAGRAAGRLWARRRPTCSRAGRRAPCSARSWSSSCWPAA